MTQNFFRLANDSIFVPENGPDKVVAPNRQLYAIMGEDHIRAMIRDFYQELSVSKIAGMFLGDLDAAAERSALFFMSLLGGPPLYAEKYGPPRLRARHLPFRITPSFQTEWLSCFDRVLSRPERYGFPSEDLAIFREFLRGFSAWMVNTSELLEE